MRELSSREVEMVSGGVRIAIVRLVLGQGVKALVKTVLSEKHSDGDACNYYNNMPAGMQ